MKAPTENIPSIRRRLLLTLFVPAAVVLIAGTLSDYFFTLPPYTEAFDQALHDSALVLAAHVQPDPAGHLNLSLPPDALAVLRAGSQDSVFFRVSAENGTFIAGDADLPIPAGTVRDAAGRDTEYHGTRIRLVEHIAYVGNERITVAIAKTTHQREAFRARILLSSVTADIFVLGLILALIWFSVRMSLDPLWAIEREITARSPTDLTPLSPGHVPQEIRSLVGALNRLFSVARETAESQRKFLENAAHQLRTPLAGIQAQLEFMAENERDRLRAERLRRILDGARRLSHTTRDLLTLARADKNGSSDLPFERVDLESIVEATVNDQLAAAERAGIDLGASLDEATVLGIEWLLAEAAKALLSNALAYTLPQGSVTVRCGTDQGAAFLEVSDTGIGIPPPERSRVVERFFRASNARGAGSGLGLAIVKDVAALHRSELSIGAGPGGVGTAVRITFPSELTQPRAHAPSVPDAVGI
jgi:two-component system, OmpR family, sensor histidine kinase TctE